jgi:hypothetical protein
MAFTPGATGGRAGPRDLAEVAQAGVGARSEEGDVDLGAADRRAGLQLHVRERLLDRALARRGHPVGVRHVARR